MRLSEHCYSHDLRCFSLAIRMLRQDARTRTINAWTGFSAERVRKLSRSLRRESCHRVAPRQRGPSPTHLEGVLTSDSLKSEAAAAAGVCRMLEVVPPERRPRVRGALAVIAQGEQVLSARELFQDIIPHPRLTLEEWLLLLHSLADGTEWAIARCSRCPAIVVVDRLALAGALCEDCQHEGRSKEATAARRARRVAAPSSRTAGSVVPQQLGLFEDKN
jgi:hypothetical protein